MSQRVLRILLPIATGFLAILLWYAARMAMGEEQRFLLPAPHKVLQAFGSAGGELFRAARNTSVGAVYGFSLSVAGSFLLALFLSLTPLIRASLYPYLMILQMTPIIVIAPILVLWAKPGVGSVTVITFLICFFPLVVNTTQGLISSDRNHVDLFRMYRATRRQEILLLRVPAALPYFFTGLRIAATLAPIGAIVGDYTAGSSAGDGGGLGYLTIVYFSRFQMAELFATAFTACLLGFCFVAIVVWLSWFSLHKWHDSFTPRET